MACAPATRLKAIRAFWIQTVRVVSVLKLVVLLLLALAMAVYFILIEYFQEHF